MTEQFQAKVDWLRCPRCGGKTRTQVRPHTVLEDFPLFARSANIPVWSGSKTEKPKK